MCIIHITQHSLEPFRSINRFEQIAGVNVIYTRKNLNEITKILSLAIDKMYEGIIVR